MSKLGEIRPERHCLDYAGEKYGLGVKDKILIRHCHGQGGNQKWRVQNEQIIHESGYCIELGTDKVGIYMQECDVNNPRQLWKWRKRV